MAWTTPKDWTTNELVTAAMMTTHVRDNLNYLFSGYPIAFATYSAANKTTISTTFVDIDATNLKLTLDVKSGRAILIAVGTWQHSSGAGAMFADWYSTTLAQRAGDTNTGLTGGVNSTSGVPCVVIGRFTGLTAGSHDFKLQWKVANGTGTMVSGTSGVVTLLGWAY
jgi:hypothetical protein